MLPIRVSDDLPWSPFDIPGGNMPARIFVLRPEPTSRAQVLLVRFPPGWERAASGSYSAAEELFVLDGSLEMSGKRYLAGDWAYFPADSLREGTSSTEGMLGLARFDGPARWTEGCGTPGGVMSAHLKPDALDEPVTGALGVGWPLRDSLAEQAWFLTTLKAGAAAPFDVEIFDVSLRTWRFVEIGAPLPSTPGPIFARAFPRV